MKIIIPIKQVPETSNVKMDKETGVIIREGVTSVINPLDLYAIELGISLKEKYGAEITALTMGPLSAHKALKEAIAMGCDQGVLVSDKRFAGADTWATSYTLAEVIKHIGDFDLVICGERATDGDTGQVGPGIAAWLDIPLATYVSSFECFSDGEITVERLVEEGYQRLQLPLPSLLTVVKEVGNPRLPTLRGKKRARQTQIPVLSTENLRLNPQFLGLKGSPTRVVKIVSPKVTRTGEIIRVETDEEIESAVCQLISFLEGKELL